MSCSLFIHISSKHMNYEELQMTGRDRRREGGGGGEGGGGWRRGGWRRVEGVCRELDGRLDIFSSLASSQSVFSLSGTFFFSL